MAALTAAWTSDVATADAVGPAAARGTRRTVPLAVQARVAGRRRYIGVELLGGYGLRALARRGTTTATGSQS